MIAAHDADATPMPDVQATRDHRRIAIDKVGVKDVRYPITLRTKGGGQQATVATIDMFVSLPHHQKGTHMSRFLEVLNDNAHPLTPECFAVVARQIKERLNADHAHLTVSFPYFIEKKAPVTGAPGLMDYAVTFEAEANNREDFIIRVKAPATSLCPCSKEISAYGAHNQRCEIEAAVRTRGSDAGTVMWIEDLVTHLEAAASAPVYACLKRPDEKFVTEQAFDNPKFVEDIVRDLAAGLEADDRVAWYSVASENFESIHNHNAYAQITRDKRG
jgi:GTP cyclohydrolase I